jgi:hypothetical protein
MITIDVIRFLVIGLGLEVVVSPSRKGVNKLWLGRRWQRGGRQLFVVREGQSSATSQKERQRQKKGEELDRHKREWEFVDLLTVSSRSNRTQALAFAYFDKLSKES